jgi:hypothetical protein
MVFDGNLKLNVLKHSGCSYRPGSEYPPDIPQEVPNEIIHEIAVRLASRVGWLDPEKLWISKVYVSSEDYVSPDLFSFRLVCKRWAAVGLGVLIKIVTASSPGKRNWYNSLRLPPSPRHSVQSLLETFQRCPAVLRSMVETIVVERLQPRGHASSSKVRKEVEFRLNSWYYIRPKIEYDLSTFTAILPQKLRQLRTGTLTC